MKEIADRGVEELSENGNAKEKFGDWRETNATLDNNKVSVNYSSQFCSSTYYNNFFGGDKSSKIMSFENCIEELICLLCPKDWDIIKIKYAQLTCVLFSYVFQPQQCLVIKFKVPSTISKGDC